jgi:predicted acyltransferase (DUF342 family)
VAGDLHAYGDVVVGAGATVAGDLKAEGNVTLLHDSVVVGALDAAADVTLRRGARCAALACGGDLHADATARAGQAKVGGRTVPA